MVEPIALVADRDKQVRMKASSFRQRSRNTRFSDNERRSNGSELDSKDEIKKEIMMDNLLRVTNDFRRKLCNNSGSKDKRFSSKPRPFQDRNRYSPRQPKRYDRNRSIRDRSNRYDEHQYEDQYERDSDWKDYEERKNDIKGI